MQRSDKPREFLTPQETADVAAAIEMAERASSAEIKLVLGTTCDADIRLMAADLFRKHGLDKTEQRNGVLVLLLIGGREFLVYGDQGIHEKVGPDFWSTTRDAMGAEFAAGRFGDGLVAGIRLIGERLARHFPHQPDDRDEISNEILYED